MKDMMRGGSMVGVVLWLKFQIIFYSVICPKIKKEKTLQRNFVLLLRKWSIFYPDNSNILFPFWVKRAKSIPKKTKKNYNLILMVSFDIQNPTSKWLKITSTVKSRMAMEYVIEHCNQY